MHGHLAHNIDQGQVFESISRASSNRHSATDCHSVWCCQAPFADAASFTRVVIGQLKPDILRQVAEDARGQKLCRALAHLYHYYLHGQEGHQDGEASQPGMYPRSRHRVDRIGLARLCVDMNWLRIP